MARLLATLFLVLAPPIGITAEIHFTKILVDGKEVSDIDFVQCPPGTKSIEISFGGDFGHDPVRLKYRMRGIDTDWKDLPAEMRVVVSFFDDAYGLAGGKDFPLSGNSPGWTGSIDTSRLTRHRETVTVPNRASRAGVWVYSGGINSATGCLLVNDIKISRLKEPGGLIYYSDFEKGRELDDTQGIPLGWQRGGSSPAMAQVARFTSSLTSHALILRDNDPEKFAEWHMSNPAFPKVFPGETIALEWNEIHTIGAGHAGTAVYRDLDPGEYIFEAVSCDENGMPLSTPILARIAVPIPLWKSHWFWIALISALVLCTVAGVQFLSRRKLRLQFEQLEQQKSLESERTRIARDLHDDLGASLTQIALLSELTKSDFNSPELALNHLDGIFNTARTVSRQLDEIVWAVNPSNDSMGSFTAYLSEFAQDYLRSANIRCRLDFSDSLPERVMNSVRRHNLFLATKEALNNVVKHAKANEIWLRIKTVDGRIVVSVEDDGTGFVYSEKVKDTGNGLKNMTNRIAQTGGQMEVFSTPGSGTRIVFSVPV